MQNEIEKLCSEIKPETMVKYAESKGWECVHKMDSYDGYANEDCKRRIYIPLEKDDLDTLENFEDRPILAILFDLWKIQNPGNHFDKWLIRFFNMNGMKHVANGIKLNGKRIAELEEHNTELVDYAERVQKMFRGVQVNRNDISEKCFYLEAEVKRLKDGIKNHTVSPHDGCPESMSLDCDRDCLSCIRRNADEVRDLIEEPKIRSDSL